MQVSLSAEAIRNEKVKVIQSMEVVELNDVVMGQYRGRKEKNGHNLPGCESAAWHRCPKAATWYSAHVCCMFAW